MPWRRSSTPWGRSFSTRCPSSSWASSRRLGQNASKMLLTAVAIAYLSSVGAAAFSAASGYAIIPHLSVPTEVSGLVDLPKPSFVLDIPPLMSVMSALVTALALMCDEPPP